MLLSIIKKITKKREIINKDTIAFSDKSGRYFNKQGEELHSVTDEGIDTNKSYITIIDDKGRKQIIGENRR